MIQGHKPLLLVAACALIDADGRVLIAQRPEGKQLAGLWEFPGGKVEPGESPGQALRRELEEELGIVPTQSRRLIRIPHRYPERSVLLDVWLVEAFSGDPHGRQGQPLRWVAPDALPDHAFPAANRPIVAAARLPQLYLITPDCGPSESYFGTLEKALARGIRLVQVRAPSLPQAEFKRLAKEVIRRCRDHDAAVLINGAPELALELGADGVHLNGRRLQALEQRPLPARFWCAASCHDAMQLRQACVLGLDFAVLSPVQPTASHPGASPLGWQRFQELVWDLPLPVYALGGLGPNDLPRALAARAQGVAAIRALWG